MFFLTYDRSKRIWKKNLITRGGKYKKSLGKQKSEKHSKYLGIKTYGF